MRVSPSSGSRSPRVPRARVAALGLAVGGLVAAVGGVSVSGAQTSHATTGVVLSTLKTAKFGTILVSGLTVYTLKPTGPGCNAACLKYWPQVLLPRGVTKATAGPGVNSALIGTMKRAGGRLQVTYAGKALYWFSKDTARGQVKGVLSDTWGKWSVVVTAKRAGSGTTTTTSAAPHTTTTSSPTTTTTAKSGSTTTTHPPSTTTTSPGSGGGIGF